MMNAARALRAAVSGDPAAMMQLHKVLTLVWALVIIPVLLTDLKNSVAIVVLISIYANIVGHWSSWQAARSEVKIDDQDN